jgi:hypothetical protein
MGRMFRHAVKLYIYPMRQDAYDRYLTGGQPTQASATLASPSHAFAQSVMITARNLQVSYHLRNLYAHLLENGKIDCIVGSNPDYLNIFSRDVLQKIKSGDPTWSNFVPTKVAEFIKERRLLGYTAKPSPTPEKSSAAV